MTSNLHYLYCRRSKYKHKKVDGSLQGRLRKQTTPTWGARGTPTPTDRRAQHIGATGRQDGRKRKRTKQKIPRPHTSRRGNWPPYPPTEGPEGSRPHIPPPAARPCRFHRWGEEMPTNRAKDRADAQRLVATRLLDRLHDPLGHFGRLQRIYPRAW